MAHVTSVRGFTSYVNSSTIEGRSKKCQTTISLADDRSSIPDEPQSKWWNPDSNELSDGPVLSIL